jgi:hypothetical protein
MPSTVFVHHTDEDSARIDARSLTMHDYGANVRETDASRSLGHVHEAAFHDRHAARNGRFMTTVLVRSGHFTMVAPCAPLTTVA